MFYVNRRKLRKAFAFRNETLYKCSLICPRAQKKSFHILVYSLPVFGGFHSGTPGSRLRAGGISSFAIVHLFHSKDQYLPNCQVRERSELFYDECKGNHHLACRASSVYYQWKFGDVEASRNPSTMNLGIGQFHSSCFHIGFPVKLASYWR